MSFPMTHLIVAYKLLPAFPAIKDKGAYIVGSIAPDSVHFNEKYSGELKSKSHLFKYGPKWGETVDNEGWLNNIKQFWINSPEGDRDFILGYTVHVLTDWMNDVYVWQPFRDQYETVTWEGTAYKNITKEEFDRIFSVFRSELAIMNQYLYGKCENRTEIFDLLKNGRQEIIPGLIEKEDLKKAVASLLYSQFELKENYGQDNLIYYTEKVVDAFINNCVNLIPDLIGCK